MKTLQGLVEDAFDTVESGYYDAATTLGSDSTSEYTETGTGSHGRPSLVESINGKAGKAIICEIKFASPSSGRINDRHDEVSQIARTMESAGAAGLSVLTEPKNFSGSLANLKTARISTNLPIIMKDIVVSPEQIKTASRLGASAILFIQEIFSLGYAKQSLTLPDAIRFAKKEDLEVIVETHSEEGIKEVAKLDCDIIGINNRDLKTFKTTIDTTIDLISQSSFVCTALNRLIMSESGFESAQDIDYILKKLKDRGSPAPKAFLIGTSIMRSPDIQSKVREFTEGFGG
ncbi:MAG: indole-3-glycerol-phosphate synthase [Thaumarchaeota archaeon]|nr:indole-3-glycerol-phosphate synthase [Nitrososphaerota archaeon]